jgi:hypothetical protein
MKDLIISTISENYEWTDIKNWIGSLKKTSYSGDILFICYNFNSNKDYIDKLNDLGVLTLTPQNTYKAELENNFLWHSGYVNNTNANKLIHNVRLFHLWQYFTENKIEDEYNRIIFMDGRDVIFQKNPSEWLDKNMTKEIIVPSEGVLYRDQSWNMNNALINFGPYIYEYLLKDDFVFNVGTFACTSTICKDLCLIMYLMSNNIGHADQPSFNILTKTILKDKCQIVDYNDLWAFQIGAIVDNIDDYCYFKNGLVYSKKYDEPYFIVHQYDRIPQFKSYFDKNI